MKSKTSLFKKAVFKRNLRGYSGLWIGLILLYVFCMPLPVYLRLANNWYLDLPKDELIMYKAHQMIEIIWTMPLFVPIFALAALVTAMVVFSYLFTGRNANMMHTFPVSRLSLFCTNYVTGILFLVLPQVVGIMLALLTGAVNGAVTSEVIKYSMIWIGIAAGESWFFFSMAVCVLMFAGNIVAVPVFYFIINFLYQGCKFIFYGMLSTVSYGLMNATDGRLDSSNLLTPLIYMSRHIRVEKIYSEDNTFLQFQGETAFLIYLASALVFTGISIIVYEKKHLETAGDVITVGWLKPIFRWGAAICVSALGTLIFMQLIYGYSLAKILISVTILGIMAFYIAQMVLERTMRVFTKGKARECIVFVAFMCVIYIGLDADVLGIEKKMPQKDEIQAVIIDGALQFYAQSSDEISWAMDIHQQIIDAKDAFSKVQQQRYMDNIEYISLIYCLEDDQILKRSYYIPIDENPQSVYGQVHTLASKPDTILKQYFGIHYPQVRVYGGNLDFYNSSEGIPLNQEEAEQIYQALIKDIEEGNFESKEDSQPLGGIYLNIHDAQGFITPRDALYSNYGTDEDGTAEFTIYDDMVNLMKVLKKLGYEPDELITEVEF